jgi:hypothetical protein
MNKRKDITPKKKRRKYVDTNTYLKDRWPELRKAVETAIDLEPDPDKKAKMEWELADLARDVAIGFMTTRYKFPEPAADFEKLLKEAHQDVEKQRRLQEIFDKSVRMAGQAVDFTQKVVAFLAKYGKYLAMV